MKDLMNDISRCNPQENGCDVKENCARFTSKGNPTGWHYTIDASSMRIDVSRGCDMYIDNEREA